MYFEHFLMILIMGEWNTLLASGYSTHIVALTRTALELITSDGCEIRHFY